MKKVSLIENVAYLGRLKDKVIFSSNNTLYSFNKEHNYDEYIKQNDKIQYVETYNKERILLNENSIYKDDTLEVQFDKENQSINVCSNELILKEIDFEKEKIDFFRFNILTKEKEELNVNKTSIPIALCKDVLILKSLEKDGYFIDFYSIISEEYFEKFSLNKLLKNDNAKVYGEPIVLNDRLFIYLFDSTHKTNDKKTICFDINKGELLWESNVFTGWSTISQGKIYSVKNKSVQILNPNTFELTNIDLQEELSVLDYRINDTVNSIVSNVFFSLSTSVYKVYNDYLYFSQEKGSTVGVIDLENKKLVWHSKIEIKSGDIIPLVLKIEFNNNHLYVLDSSNTLQIYVNDKVL
ncbi:hypothetical protein VBY74_09720 [Tenacibaculum ascidiaceicola]|uniref:hypothetical protein n=1 Tax=Tenacibaculum ascidiaceicola TaxID=1699411 RepID=UPI0039EAC6EB